MRVLPEISGPLALVSILTVVTFATIACRLWLIPTAEYKKKYSILSKGETAFWEVLRQALPAGTLLAVKPRLADLFEPTSQGRGARQTALNRIACKHVDFLVIDRQGRPLLGIEIDDRSHQRKDRQQRDRFVDRVFKNADLPILHLPAQRSYNPEELRETLKQKLSIPDKIQQIPTSKP